MNLEGNFLLQRPFVDKELFNRASAEPHRIFRQLPKSARNYISEDDEVELMMDLMNQNSQKYIEYVTYKIYHFIEMFHGIKLLRFRTEFFENEFGDLELSNATIYHIYTEKDSIYKNSYDEAEHNYKMDNPLKERVEALLKVQKRKKKKDSYLNLEKQKKAKEPDEIILEKMQKIFYDEKFNFKEGIEHNSNKCFEAQVNYYNKAYALINPTLPKKLSEICLEENYCFDWDRKKQTDPEKLIKVLDPRLDLNNSKSWQTKVQRSIVQKKLNPFEKYKHLNSNEGDYTERFLCDLDVTIPDSQADYSTHENSSNIPKKNYNYLYDSYKRKLQFKKPKEYYKKSTSLIQNSSRTKISLEEKQSHIQKSILKKNIFSLLSNNQKQKIIRRNNEIVKNAYKHKKANAEKLKNRRIIRSHFGKRHQIKEGTLVSHIKSTYRSKNKNELNSTDKFSKSFSIGNRIKNMEYLEKIGFLPLIYKKKLKEMEKMKMSKKKWKWVPQESETLKLDFGHANSPFRSKKDFDKRVEKKRNGGLDSGVRIPSLLLTPLKS